MATTKKLSGRAASVAQARHRIRNGAVAPTHAARASATIPAAVLSVVPHEGAPQSFPVPGLGPVTLHQLLELQREALLRLNVIERLLQRSTGEIESLRRDFVAADPTTPAPDEPAEPTPDPPDEPTPDPEPAPGESDPEPDPAPESDQLVLEADPESDGLRLR